MRSALCTRRTPQREDLAPFTKAGTFSHTAGRDFHLFYFGRDDEVGVAVGVHLTRARPRD